MTDQNVKHVALAYIWRLVYEGLGLSGYSEKATAAMAVIDCAKSDSTKGWRVAKSINQNPVQYDYAFKLGNTDSDGLDPNSWCEASGPQELISILGDETNITREIAIEIFQSAAVLRTYKKIEQEGLKAIGEKSGYFQFVQQGIVQGALRRIGQGDTGSTVADSDGEAALYDPEYNPDTAPGKSLPELFVERGLVSEIKFDPLAALTQKIAVAHQQIRIANSIVKSREDAEMLE